ncbi:MAG: TIGR00730 family Rossman fold protein [Pseudomonadota bacterium]
MPAAAPFSVCVYCGSRDGADPAFRTAAEALGRGLAERGMRLVYGAGDVGLMGAVARAAQTAGGATLGVIPAHLQGREGIRPGLGTLVVTETMHERKKVMFMNADAVVALPGGPGTLDELFEALTWRQLRLHDKPALALDIAGYWRPLFTLIDHMVAQGFCDASFRDSLERAETPEALLARLDALRP